MPTYEELKVLVTGGAGFIGSHLSEALVERGARVSVVDDLSAGRRSNLGATLDRLDFRELDLGVADLEDFLAESGFDMVFHLAGHVDVPASVADPAWDLERNGLNGFRVLEALRSASQGTRFVFASSAAVYGEALDRPLTEEDGAVPVAPYGVSKLMVERYAAVYASVYGMRTASLRLFPVYGPRVGKHVVYDFIAKVHRDPERLEILGDGRQVRDFTYVRDAVDAFLRVGLDAPLRGEVYNMASGRPVSIRELAELVCAQAGVSPSLEFTGEVGPGVSSRWVADVSRLEALGFRARVDLADGVSRTIEWYREEQRTGDGT